MMTSVSGSTTDRIHKQVLLQAPRSRVWQALADMPDFGAWFGVDLPHGAFRPGAQVAGHFTNPGYTHLTMRVSVEQVEPERLLSFRWHPDALEPNVDYDQEPTTLVVFELNGVPDGTLLTIDESGFERTACAGWSSMATTCVHGTRRSSGCWSSSGWTEEGRPTTATSM